MKKFLCILLALMLVVPALAACSKRGRGSSVDSEPSSAAVSQPVEEPDQELLLCVDLENTELKAAFLDRINEWGCVEDDEILYNVNAWPQDGAGVVVRDTVQGEVSIVYSGSGMPQDGENVTSASSTVSLNDLIDLALESDPEIKNLGVLYAADNETAAVQVQAAQSYCAEKGITLEQTTVNNAGEISQSAAELCARVDALLTPRDEKLLGTEAAKAIAQAASEESIPWYAQDAAMVKNGALASVTPDYEALGSAAADMCVELLWGRPVTQVAARTLSDKKITVNQQTLTSLDGVKLSREILETADFIG